MLMLVEKKVLNKIKDFGLNSYEAKIWTALLSRGVSTAGEISDIANVPRSRSYDVLESLEKKGFIVMKIGKPIQYIAVPPEEVLERVKKNIRDEAEEKVDVLKEFEGSDLLQDLKELHNKGIESVDPTDITGYVKGMNNIYDHMSMMIKNAENSVMISANGLEGLSENLSRVINKASRKEVVISISSEDDAGLEVMENVGVKDAGLEGRFMVVDSEKVLFFITGEDTHKSYETAVWVESHVLAKMFGKMFKQEWTGKKVDVKTNIKAEVKKKAR